MLGGNIAEMILSCNGRVGDWAFWPLYLGYSFSSKKQERNLRGKRGYIVLFLVTSSRYTLHSSPPCLCPEILIFIDYSDLATFPSGLWLPMGNTESTKWWKREIIYSPVHSLPAMGWQWLHSSTQDHRSCRAALSHNCNFTYCLATVFQSWANSFLIQ